MTDRLEVATKPAVLGDKANGAPQGSTVHAQREAFDQMHALDLTPASKQRLRAATRRAIGRA